MKVKKTVKSKRDLNIEIIKTMSSSNPKDVMAQTKLQVHLVPTELVREVAKAMDYGAHKAKRKDGEEGYGEFNWRSTEIRMTVYVAAIIRHALDLLDGEDLAPDSKILHLGHIGANVGILLDAKKHGCLVDDRSKRRTVDDEPKHFGKL